MISVVIPTRNEEEHIANILSDIKNQTYKNSEVIVVDACSADRTRAIAKKFGAKVVTSDKRNIAHDRNLGIKHSRGDILAHIDADFRINRDFLRAIAACFRNSHVGGVRMRETFTKDSLWETLDYLRTQHKYGDYSPAVRIFRRGPMFDEDLVFFNDDIAIRNEIRGKIVNCRGAVMTQHRYHSFAEIVNSWKRYASGIVYYQKYGGRLWALKWMKPLFFPILTPFVTIHRLVKFRDVRALLIPLYDTIRSVSYLYGMLAFVFRKPRRRRA